jgi:hypothetical protein
MFSQFITVISVEFMTKLGTESGLILKYTLINRRVFVDHVTKIGDE